MHEFLNTIVVSLSDFFPLGIALCLMAVAMWVAHRILEREVQIADGDRLKKQAVLLGIALLGVLCVVLTLPVSGELRGQLLSVLGILLSATVALSATTLLGNALATVMLRAVRSFRMGDFIQVNEHFGRVSERGLFHTEIQTEDRDLITLPNLYLVTQPVKTLRSSGTIVSATVSLGYDVARTSVEEHLLAAAREVELEEPFVHVMSLGDYSVTYRVAGLLPDISRLISTRSRLRSAMIDALHTHEVEIVSPTFMNQRVFPPEQRFFSRTIQHGGSDTSPTPEDTVFDKAEDAEALEQLQERHVQLDAEITELKATLREGEVEDAQRTQIEHDISQRVDEQEHLLQVIEERKAAVEEKAAT